MVTFISASTSEIDYRPCDYDVEQVYCWNVRSEQVLEAFQRNRNNTKVESLTLELMDDMTDEIAGEIFSIIASASVDNLHGIYLSQLEKVAKLPEAVRKFKNLQYVFITNMEGITTLPSGSMTFGKSPYIYLMSTHLEVIEPGAFQGSLNGSIIFLSNNKLTEFDRAVFEPFLSDINQIYFDGNPTLCDCSLAWIIRDHHQLVNSTVFGDCLDENGTRIDFAKIDPNTLKDC